MPINKIINKESSPQEVKPEAANDLKNEVVEPSYEQSVDSAVEIGAVVAETKKNIEVNNPTGVSSSANTNQIAVTEVKSELRLAVERVMEADLRDLYLAMTPTERQIFKKKGEETAKEITSLMEKTKINLNKIIKLLFGWLRLLPGVNNYFIEQEAKLKADQLFKLPK